MLQFMLLLMVLSAPLMMFSSAARADIYGYVENGRTKLLYTDAKPADPRYKLYKRDALGSSESKPPQRVADCCTKYASFTRSRYNSHVMAASAATQVEPALIHAVISVESAYNPRAISRAGAVGLMQLMPETAKRYGVNNRMDPEQNIHGGARYLRFLMNMFDNNIKLVLAAYNAGEEAVMKYGKKIPPYRETQNYVPKVLHHYQRYSSPKLAAAGTAS
jgi:soluble lytic murein transglycosylase-like protein